LPKQPPIHHQRLATLIHSAIDIDQAMLVRTEMLRSHLSKEDPAYPHLRDLNRLLRVNSDILNEARGLVKSSKASIKTRSKA
jgi:hypothetical protein